MQKLQSRVLVRGKKEDGGLSPNEVQLLRDKQAPIWSEILRLECEIEKHKADWLSIQKKLTSHW
jgi:hypothetical protein